MSNIIKYDTSTIKFLMLNILGHDVIHDFGGDATPDRWARNSDIIRQFTNTFTMSSKSKKRKTLSGGQTETTQVNSTSSNSATNVYQMRLKMPPLSEEEIYDNFYKMVDDFKNSCIFATFYYKIYENTSSTWGLSDLLKGAFGFVVEASENTNMNLLLDTLFTSLCNEFVSYLYSTNSSFQQFLQKEVTDINNFAMSFDQWYKILDQFLYTNYVLDDLMDIFDQDITNNNNSNNNNISSSNNNNISSSNNNNISSSNNNNTNKTELNFEQYGPIIGKKRTIEQLGGAVKNEQLTDVKPLLAELDQYKTKYLTEENLVRLGKIFTKFRDNENEMLDQEEYKQYSQERIQMLTELKGILNKYGQNKLSGQLDNKSIDNTPDSFIPILRKSRYGKVSNSNTYPREGALNFFENSIYNPYNKLTNINIINHEKTDIQNVLFFIKKVNQEYNKKLREEQNALKPKFVKINSNINNINNINNKNITEKNSSKLTDGEKNVRQGFNEIIARTILYLLKICDKSGNLLVKRSFLNEKYNNIDELLKEQIKILLCESNWLEENDRSWRDIFQIQYLDGHLYEICDSFFTNKKMVVDNGAELYCGEKENVGRLTNSKYIIDNAASVLNDGIKSRIFCSTSSILDGMYQCAYNIATKRLEQGNMNFTILSQNASDKMIYNGKSSIVSLNDKKNKVGENSIQYNITVKTPMGDINPENIYSILGTENPYLNMDRSSLKSPLISYSVLKNTLLLFIKQVEKLNNDSVNDYQEIIRTTIRLTNNDVEPSTKKRRTTTNINTNSNSNSNELTSSDKETPSFFRNYFNLQLDGKHNNFNFFFNILANIYFKGSGDLFQELNVCCKNGAYLNDGSYYADPTIIKWSFEKTDGNTLRMFIARDRPSACRFAIMTLFGDDAGINKYAFGGYSSTTKTLIVSRLKMSNPNKKGKELLCKNVGLKGGNKLTKRKKYNSGYRSYGTRKNM
jgi:hypothetical protein